MASSSSPNAYTSPPPASPSLPAPAAGPSKVANPAEPPRPILETTWHALSQTPPPSLREILGAYNSKGEGDRDMLIALLNAKSAEDQRLASIATLHQTVLQMQHALAIAAVTAQSQSQSQAQSPPGRVPQPPTEQMRRKRSHAEYAPDAYRLHPYHDRDRERGERERGEPPLPPSPDSSASASSPRADFPHLSNPGSMSIRTLLHPSKRRRESGGYDERDRERERAYDERDRYEEREYRVRDPSSSRRPHVVVHPPSVERDSRYAMRTSSARDEAVEPAGRSP
ncbi:hypothetical protein BDV93DRAFT_601491 [Ceratobasidium sp. AG-I]|nr:hypothetical protein BDV93DRAFT_601491 [Ceratobasidium sp. AG-I]